MRAPRRRSAGPGGRAGAEWDEARRRAQVTYRRDKFEAAAMVDRIRPGPPGAVKRPRRFPQQIGFLWGLLYGRAGRLTAKNGGFPARAVQKAAGHVAPQAAAAPLNAPGGWDCFLSHGQAAAGDQVRGRGRGHTYGKG
jgi:hypothetical protein